MTDTIEICIRQPLRRPGPKGERISIYAMLGLMQNIRDTLKVPKSAKLLVWDPTGDHARLGPTK